MFVPSVEAAKITIVLFEKYTSEQRLENVHKLNYKYVSPEDYLQEHFAQKQFSESLQELVTEFFFLLLKYQTYLTKIVAESFSFKTAASSRNGISTSLAFVYLLVIELNEMTQNKIEEILTALNIRMAMSLLEFFKKPDTLQKLYEWGCEIWDVEFVKSSLKNVIDQPLFEEVYDNIKKILQKKHKNTVKPLTIPVGPKCLMRPKKILPKPEPHICFPPVSRIPIIIKANQVPSSTYVTPVQIEKIEQAKKEHRKKAISLLEDAQKNMFRCAKAGKSEKFKEIVEKIEKEMYEMPRKAFSSKEVKHRKVQSPKKTAAVILREGARLLKLEQEEIKRYEDLANGGFNSDTLAQLEEEIREEEFRKHLENIEKKHLEGLLSYEEALLAKQKFLKKKKKSAYEFRKEKEAWLKQLEAWRNEEQLRIQASVEKGKALEKGAKEAVEQVKEEKHKIVLEVMEESKALKQQSLKEREEELQRKVQIIKEIKALQALGVVKKKLTDFTETANLGLLCEMSIVELKERLFILRLEIQEELERRRTEIRMKKECRREIIESYEEIIKSHRGSVKESKKKVDAQDKDERKEMKKSASLEILQRKLYEKRRERMKHQNMI